MKIWPNSCIVSYWSWILPLLYIQASSHLTSFLDQIIKHHSQEVGLQRRVFVDFFCNPERLRNQVRELTARVRAMQVS